MITVRLNSWPSNATQGYVCNHTRAVHTFDSVDAIPDKRVREAVYLLDAAADDNHHLNKGWAFVKGVGGRIAGAGNEVAHYWIDKEWL